MTIGQKIRKLRRDKNLNQTELGKIIGVKPQAVSAYENDEIQLSFQKMQILCEEFKIPLTYFLSEKEISDIPQGFKEEQPTDKLVGVIDTLSVYLAQFKEERNEWISERKEWIAERARLLSIIEKLTLNFQKGSIKRSPGIKVKTMPVTTTLRIA